MRSIIRFILVLFSRLVLWRYHPVVVAVTGSVGKTSTKDAIFTILYSQHRKRIRRTFLNQNTEIGVPLTILGIPGGGRNPFRWLWRFLRVLQVALWSPSYPKLLVLEMGADRPGDIQFLVRLARPHVAVVTAVGEIPVHVEFFAGPKTVAREKARLVESVPPDGWAVLNFDDLTVLDMREETRAHVLTFGFGEGADVRATAYEVRKRMEGGAEIPDGIAFKIEYQGKIVPVRLANMFGKSAVMAALGAAAVGLAMRMHLVEISEALADFEGPPGRLHLFPGVKKSFLLDDTYNAAPQAMHMALDTLAELPAGRRIAVLGDMLELGKYTELAHREVGRHVGRVAHTFVAVGDRMRFAADEAVATGMDPDRVHLSPTPHDAGILVQGMLEERDLVLVKGSRAMHMERIVTELRAYAR